MLLAEMYNFQFRQCYRRGRSGVPRVETKPPLPLLLLPPELPARTLGGGGGVARKFPLEREPIDAVPPEELLCASAELCNRQASSSATHRALNAMHRPAYRLVLRQGQYVERFS